METTETNTLQVIAVLCHTETCCPTIALDPAAEAAQKVVIQDDFGQVVRMSREQFQVLIDLAQAGKLALIGRWASCPTTATRAGHNQE